MPIFSFPSMFCVYLQGASDYFISQMSLGFGGLCFFFFSLFEKYLLR